MNARVILWAPLASAVLLIGLFAIALTRGEDDDAGDTRIDRPLPALPLEAAPGFAGYDPAAIDGPYLLNVWASWCPPCRVEHPTLQTLHEAGVPIYGVVYKDEPGDARAFIARFGDVWTAQMADPGGRAAIELGVTGPPETFIVDGEGVVRARFRGAITPEIWQSRLAPVWAEAVEQETSRRNEAAR